MTMKCVDCGAALDFGDQFVSPSAVTLDVECFERWFRSENREVNYLSSAALEEMELSVLDIKPLMRDGREVVWTKDYHKVPSSTVAKAKILARALINLHGAKLPPSPEQAHAFMEAAAQLLASILTEDDLKEISKE